MVKTNAFDYELVIFSANEYIIICYIIFSQYLLTIRSTDVQLFKHFRKIKENNVEKAMFSIHNIMNIYSYFPKSHKTELNMGTSFTLLLRLFKIGRKRVGIGQFMAINAHYQLKLTIYGEKVVCILSFYSYYTKDRNCRCHNLETEVSSTRRRVYFKKDCVLSARAEVSCSATEVSF